MGDRKVYCRLRILMASQEPVVNQKQLAASTGLSPTTINQLFNNSFKRIDVGTVETLCDYFRCDLSDLLVLREAD
jgi:putative transcriptional regulator